jgi:hypothetical protein
VSSNTADRADIARYYTRGVRFPRLIGKTHDGTRVPGGPYTLTQGVGGLVVFLGGWWTRPLWGNSSLIRDYLLLFIAVGLAVFALRFVRTSGRDPFTAGVALLSVYLQPRHGRLRGRTLRISRPHAVRGRPVLIKDLKRTGPPARRAIPATTIPRSRIATGLTTAGISAVSPAPPGPRERTPVLSGVGQLLAASAPRPNLERHH